jgi:shikimate kinase
MIISLGGGTPCYANNHELLKQEGYFYLSKIYRHFVCKIVLQ